MSKAFFVTWSVCCYLFEAAIAGTVASLLFYEAGRAGVRNEAVQVNAAEYRLNDNTDKHEFRWIKPTREKE